MSVENFKSLQTQCLQQDKLFKDLEFPPNDNSLYGSEKTRLKTKDTIEWKRPIEISVNPSFDVCNLSRSDFLQGDIGDCWFAAVLSGLTINSELFNKVVPNGQNFDANNYAGIFHFQFHRCGKVIDVVIDDYLPTRKGELIYMHSQNPNNYLSALLEKAYAKYHGGYANLNRGKPSKAMRDLFGVRPDRYRVHSTLSGEFFENLCRAHENKCIITITIGDPTKCGKNKTSEGLYIYHAYSIVDVRRFDEKFKILRLRNPWGKDLEQFNGAWSNNSREWQKYGKKLMPNSKGEFWISLRDVIKYFTYVHISN